MSSIGSKNSKTGMGTAGNTKSGTSITGKADSGMSTTEKIIKKLSLTGKSITSKASIKKSTSSKASTAKSTTSKASTAKSTTSKASTAKSTTSKASTAKSTSPKASIKKSTTKKTEKNTDEPDEPIYIDEDNDNVTETTKTLCLCNKGINSATTPVFWVFGIPGSERNSFARNISLKYGLDLLTTGDLLRKEMKSNSKNSEIAQRALMGDHDICNDLIIQLLAYQMLQEADYCKGYVINGFPRNLTQSCEFQDRIISPKAIFFFQVSKSELTKHFLIKCRKNEVDDKIRTYLTTTDQIISAYHAKVKKIKGDKSPTEVLTLASVTINPIIETAQAWREKNIGLF